MSSGQAVFIYGSFGLMGFLPTQYTIVAVIVAAAFLLRRHLAKQMQSDSAGHLQQQRISQQLRSHRFMS